jgi:AraC-like DNA-binding protein
VRVDVLSDALALMRTGAASSVRTDARAPWGLRFGRTSGASFHVVLAGTCWLIPPASDPIALSPGDVVFLRSGHEHVLADDPASPVAPFEPGRVHPSSPIGEIVVAGPGARTVLLCGAYRLDLDRPHPLLSDLPELVHLPARFGRRTPLRGAIDLLRAELEEPGPGTDGIVPTLVEALLLYILRAWFEECRDEGPRGWAAALGDPAVGAALRAMHDEPTRPWTVQELGRHAGLSRAAFAKRFTALVGEPPLTYLSRWRLTLAARLLRESDLSIGAVARKVGYGSEFTFAKAFKRANGLAPSRFRVTPDAVVRAAREVPAPR